MYFTIVDETGSCRLLIMLGDGPRCKKLGDKFFLKVGRMVLQEDGTPMLLQETLKTPFSNNTNDDEKKKNLPAGGTPETHTLREQVVLSRIFKRMVPVDCSYQ